MLPEKKILRHVAAELAANPSWKIIVLKNNWLCPFCGEIGAGNLTMEQSLEHRIAEHIASRCPRFAGDFGKTAPLDASTLEKKAALIAFKHRVRKLLGTEPAWRVTDGDGAWICPFCARSTGIELAELGRIPADGDSTDALDDRTLARAVRHLLECEDCAEGRGEEKPVAALLERRAAIDRKRGARRVREQLEKDPAWQLRVRDRRWLCPFCAEPVPDVRMERGAPLTDPVVDRAAEHLSTCAAALEAGRDGRGPRPLDALKERVSTLNKSLILRELRKKVRTHAIWQMVDADGTWYCPYCARPTAVRIADPAHVSEDAVARVWAHLCACSAYVGRQAQLKPRGYLKSVIAQADEALRLRRDVGRLLREDPRFTVFDSFGSWACPFCRKIMKQIDVGSAAGGEPLIIEKTIEQIVNHLRDECKDFREGESPEATLAEIRAAVAGAGVGVGAGSGTGTGTGAGTAGTVAEEWSDMRREVARLRSDVEISEELRKSLESARSRQLTLLPKVPEVPGFEFAVVYRPCHEVSGDFYDFIRVSESELGIAIGDIAGHGIEAALLMGLAKKLLEIHGRGRGSPKETLLLTNAEIFPDLDAKTFVTAFYGVLDTRTRVLTFARAGHNPLILFSRRRRPRLRVLDSKGMALGMDGGPIFDQSVEEISVALEPGDLLVQYTDGVTEAMNHDKEEFGLERLYATVERHGEHEAEYVLYQIEKAMSDFQEGAGPKDDVTMVAMKVHEG